MLNILCLLIGICADADSRCPGWNSYCSSNEYTKKNCKKTCNLCSSKYTHALQKLTPPLKNKYRFPYDLIDLSLIELSFNV